MGNIQEAARRASHTLEVANRVMAVNADLELPALLHDSIEESENKVAAARTIRDLYGRRVALLVLRLTRRKRETYAEYIGRVCRSREASVIKMYDLQHNMERCAEKSPTLMKRYAKAYTMVVDALYGSLRYTGG